MKCLDVYYAFDVFLAVHVLTCPILIVDYSRIAAASITR